MPRRIFRGTLEQAPKKLLKVSPALPSDEPAAVIGHRSSNNVIEASENYTSTSNDAVIFCLASITVTLTPNAAAGTPITIVAKNGNSTISGPIAGGSVLAREGTMVLLGFSPSTQNYSVIQTTLSQNAKNYQEIKTILGIQGSVAVMGGYANPGDNGGGTFVWDTSLTHSDDDGALKIVPAGSTTGGWRRVVTGMYNVKDWGATGDGITDDTAAIQAALNRPSQVDYNTWAFHSGGATIFFPPGVYLISSELLIPLQVPLRLQGSGRDSSNIRQKNVGNVLRQTSPTLSDQSVTIADLTLSNLATANLSGEFQTGCTWTPNTTVALGLLVNLPGASNRLLKCTSAGKTGPYLPFGSLWCGTPSAPLFNPYAITPLPQIKITGAPLANYRHIVIIIDSGGQLSGGIAGRWSTDGWTTVGGSFSTSGAPVALTGTGLTANFESGTYEDVPGSGGNLYCSPAWWTGFSNIVGDIIVDGTAQWTVIDGGTGLVAENVSNWQVDRVGIVGCVTGLVIDNCETMTFDRMQIGAAICVLIADSNSRMNAPTDTPRPSGVCNVIEFGTFDNLDAGSIGIVDAGNASHFFHGAMNFEGAANPSWQVYISNTHSVSFSKFESEGSSKGFYIGGIQALTGLIGGGAVNTTLEHCVIDPNGHGNPPLLQGGTNPPNVTTTGFNTGVVAFNQVIRVHTPGPLSSATIDHSENGGATWTSNVAIASGTVVLGSGGLIATFPTGTYSADNIWHAPILTASVFDFTTASGLGGAPFSGLTMDQCWFFWPFIVYGTTDASYGNGLQLGTNAYSPGLGTFLDIVPPMVVIETRRSGQTNGAFSGIGLDCVPAIHGIDNNAAFCLRSIECNPYTCHITNGVNLAVANPIHSVVEIAGTDAPSSDFTIAGLQGGTEGQIIKFINYQNVNMTMSHQNSSVTDVATRLICSTGADIVIPPVSGGFSWAELRYSASQSRWLVIGTG